MYREKSISVVLTVFALIAAGITSSCSAKPKDADLVTNIQSQMFADAQLKGANVEVDSVQGLVTLKGGVPNDAARYEAYKIAAQTTGVTKVNDQMTVGDQSAQMAPPPAAEPAPAPSPVALKPKPVAMKPEPKPKKHEVHHDSDSRRSNNEMASNMMQSAPPSSMPPPQSAPPSDSQQVQQEQTAPPPAAPAPPPPPQPIPVQIAAGTTVTIRMIDGIDSSVNKAGEVFHASLDAPLVVGDDVIVRKGADIYVRLANASSAGKISGQSELRLELVKLDFQGHAYPLVSTTYSLSGNSRGKDTAKKVGGGAVLGAIIGAIAGGGKGAAIGAAAGGGAGTVYQGVTHGQQVKIPAETKLDFQLDQPVTVNVMPKTNQ